MRSRPLKATPPSSARKTSKRRPNRPLKTSPSSTIKALRRLEPSGDESFEELVALLFARASGERIRRCKSGAQNGLDALADIPFGIEDKRYEAAVEGRVLLGGLGNAAVSHPALQLWILVATCEVKSQDHKSLTELGLRLGIGVYVLDAMTCHADLPGVSGIAALAATDIETTLAVLANPAWRAKGRKPELKAIRAELVGIRKLPGFEAWEERLRAELRDLPTWRRLVRSQNQKVRTQIQNDAFTSFNTGYHPKDAVPRTAEGELGTWWQSGLTSDASQIVVVTGDRYDGKSWLVYRWLSETLPTLPVPVFFLSSYRVKAAGGDIEPLLLSEARDSLGSFARHADAILQRQKARAAGAGPWCVIILDGADEYAADPEARGAAILYAAPVSEFQRPAKGRPEEDKQSDLRADDSVSPERRSAALLLTCRAQVFDDDSSWLGTRGKRRIALGAYDETEFREALVRNSLSPEKLANLAPSALKMLRRPRYLGLVAKHQKDMGEFPAITPEVLHYLDASDKVRAPGSAGSAWGPEEFKELLVKLATTWTLSRRLDLSTLRGHVGALTERVDQVVAALKSEGVFRRGADGLEPDMERLALGMGLHLRETLLRVPQSGDLSEALVDMLEPHRDDDERVRWLRSAVTTSVLAGDAVTHPKVSETLLGTWLAARNFSAEDLEALRSLAPFLAGTFVHLLCAPDLKEGNLVLAEPIIEAGFLRHEPAIIDAVPKWLRIVPIGSRWYVGGDARKGSDAKAAVSHPSLRDLLVTIPQRSVGETVRKLQRLGLALAYVSPHLLKAQDVLALLGGRNAAGGYLGDGEAFAVRSILAVSSRDWFEVEVQAWEQHPEAPRTELLWQILSYADRNDLADLSARLPGQSRPAWTRSALDRDDFLTLIQRRPTEESEPLEVAARARFVAPDPSIRALPSVWRRALKAAATNRFSLDMRLHAYVGATKDDHDLESVEPALTAWAPQVVAEIWRQFLVDIPRRIEDREVSWSWEVEGHAALLTDADRRRLLAAIRSSIEVANAGEPGYRRALERAYLCVLVGASGEEQTRLLLDHPFNDDWVGFYEVLAVSRGEVLRRAAQEASRTGVDPERLKRARYLLGYLGGADLSPEDLEALIQERSLRGPGEDAARFLLKRSRVATDTSAGALGPLVRVAESLSDSAWQYEAFLDRQRNPDARGCIWVAWAMSAPGTARHNGAENASPDEVAVGQGIEILGRQVADQLKDLPKGKSPMNQGEQLPDGVVRALSLDRFDEWVELLLASPDLSRHFCSGLLVPVVRRALRGKHPRARELWALVYPFQRGPSSSGARITVEGGLHWVLREILDAAVDDALARQILKDLVADCRSDSELVQVAMAARLESAVRLSGVVADGLASTVALDRARARFIAGWMPEDEVIRKAVSAADPSRWVERIGVEARRRLDREAWARHWLARFLAEPNRVRRWAAGRLFLECSDAATQFWAGDLVWESKAPPSRRGEAQLLIRKLRKKTDDSDLRDKFLGCQVRELAEVVPPWRRKIGWGDIVVTPEERTWDHPMELGES